MTNKKVIVIGLDGVTWDLIKPWAKEGKLPTLKKLMESGVYCDLESTIPPLTAPAWVSFATGKNPGKHGCYDFILPRKSLNDMKPITTKDIHGKTFYEILYENGKKCIIINLPGSYPPRIKEIVITSLLTQGNNFIFPPNLVTEIPELKNYRIIPDKSLRESGRIMESVNDIRKLEKNRFECAKKLFKKDWNFFFLLFTGTDTIQHMIYDKLISGTMDDDSYPIKAYKEIDEYIGWFVDNVPQDTNILIMSDHGFRAYKKVFFINSWLRREGYLKVEQRLKKQIKLHKLAEEIEKARSKRINIKLPTFLLNYLKFFTWMYPFYIKLKNILPIEIQRDILQPRLLESIAYAYGTMSYNISGIYINDKKRFIDGKVEMSDYENVRTEIINKLKQLQLKDPKTGENIIKNVWKKEDIYSGSQLYMAPDIIFMLIDEYRSMTNLLITKLFDDKFVDRMNTHALQGVFLAYGPDIKKGEEIKCAKIYDIAPTILFMFDMSISKDMDGRVLKEIFRDDSELAKREIKYQEIDEKERIKEKIKILKDLIKI